MGGASYRGGLRGGDSDCSGGASECLCPHRERASAHHIAHTNRYTGIYSVPDIHAVPNGCTNRRTGIYSVPDLHAAPDVYALAHAGRRPDLHAVPDIHAIANTNAVTRANNRDSPDAQTPRDAVVGEWHPTRPGADGLGHRERLVGL